MEDATSLQFARRLDRARAGDPHALGLILSNLEHRLRRFAASRIGAELRQWLSCGDVLQDTYLQVLRRLPSFHGDDEDELAAWIARILDYEIHRQIRWIAATKRRRPQSLNSHCLADTLKSAEPLPIATAIGKEQSRSVSAAISKLSAEHRRVIVLASVSQLPHREIAERMRRTEKATRMLLVRARNALRVQLNRGSNSIAGPTQWV